VSERTTTTTAAPAARGKPGPKPGRRHPPADSDEIPRGPLLDAVQLAIVFRVTPATVVGWSAAGTFPPPVSVNFKLHRWRRSDVIMFINRGGNRPARGAKGRG
jgi:hypothetical protein